MRLLPPNPPQALLSVYPCPVAMGLQSEQVQAAIPNYRQDLAPGYRSCCFWQPTSGFATRQ